MKKVLALLFIFVLSIGCVACSKKDNITEISKNLSNYDMTIDLNTESKTAFGVLNLDYINSSDDALNELKFHLYPQFFKEDACHLVVSSTKLNDAYPNGMSYSEFEVSRVKVEDTDAIVQYSGEYDDILVVDLNSNLLPNNRINIEIEFNFTLPNCEHRFGYGENTINLANFYPIACVYEDGAFDESGYNANGDPFYSDMANYDVKLNLDNSNYIVAGTGEKTDIKQVNGKYQTTFNADLVRDFAMVISDKFEVISDKVGDTNVEYYYFSDDFSEKSLNAGIDAIETFSDLFGEYPYSNFSIVESDFIYGGMEYPNLIMISADIENIDDYMNVIIHETAHQWWYGMVGNDEYTYPWLDEALTEYSCLLFYDNNSDYNLTHSQMVDVSKSNYTLFVTVYQDVLGDLDTSMRAVDEYDTEPEYTYCTYVKGVLMYESLYQLIGEKDFVAGLKQYFNDNKYTNATPNDLIFAFENSSGNELDNFFSSWLDGKVVIR